MKDEGIVVSLDYDAFLLTHQTDHEIWVKHRASGHVVCFPVSDDGGTVEEPHRIDLNFSSTYSGQSLIQSAQRAAQQYLRVSATRQCAAEKNWCGVDQFVDPSPAASPLFVGRYFLSADVPALSPCNRNGS
jgi:hypothetical protein